MIEPIADPTCVNTPNQNRLRSPFPSSMRRMEAILTLTYVNRPTQKIHEVICPIRKADHQINDRKCNKLLIP